MADAATVSGAGGCPDRSRRRTVPWEATTEFTYHHGYWDGVEREFRGFCRVERFDSESFETVDRPGLHGSDTAFARIDAQQFGADMHEDLVSSGTGS